jgi:hypothetical protein
LREGRGPTKDFSGERWGGGGQDSRRVLRKDILQGESTDTEQTEEKGKEGGKGP